MEENLFNALTVSATFSSSSYVASDGYTIYAELSGVSSLPLLPSTGISGFYIYANGTFLTPRIQYVLNPSGSATQKSTVVIKTYVKIKPTDVVQIKYWNGNLTDNSTDTIDDIALFTITNNSQGTQYFDPLEWNNALDDGGVATGSDSGFFSDATDLFKKELTYPFAEVIDRKSTRLNSSHIPLSRMPSSA